MKDFQLVNQCLEAHAYYTAYANRYIGDKARSRMYELLTEVYLTRSEAITRKWEGETLQ